LVAVAGAGVAVFFAWANRQTAKAQARFQAADVEEALAELVSPDSRDHDTWDLFIAYPIDDPSLESVRQQCLMIIKECPPAHPREDISVDGVNRVAAILRELRSRRS
jgi:hypothetical protein